MINTIWNFILGFFISFDLKYKILFLIIIYLIGKFYYKQYTEKCEAEQTAYNIDSAEVPLGIDFKIINASSKVHYVFWTGGFDSTFRICQLLLLMDQPVQPIYIMCGDVDDSTSIISNGRENQNLEIIKMKEIRDMILKNNSHLANKFFPTFYVSSIEKNRAISKKFKRIHKKLGYFSRDINQYERMARFSLEFDKPIDVCVENCGTGIDEATRKVRIIDDNTGECRIKDYLESKNKDLEIFKKFRFPIVHLTKDEMKEISIKNNFYHIIKNSWSCWFPKNGFPCGKCKMCKERIV